MKSPNVLASSALLIGTWLGLAAAPQARQVGGQEVVIGAEAAGNILHVAQVGSVPNVGDVPPDPRPVGGTPTVANTSPTAAFVQNAALGGMAEVELGRLALARSKDAGVREFAQRMVTDHGKANEELAALAKAKGLAVPASLDAKHQAAVNGLKQSADASFDRRYIEHMNEDHDQAVNLFKTAAAETTMDAEIRAFANKTLPTLEQHREMVKRLGTRPAV
jgi:putative membrane protein